MMNYKLLSLIFIFFLSISNSYSQENKEVFYLYPTPEELIEIINEGNHTFNKELLSPIDNYDNYEITKSRNLNLGIYMADMAYCSFFSKRNNVLNYLEVIRKLSDYLLISTKLKETLAHDFTENVNSFDSLYYYTNVYYYEIMQELEYNNSENVMSLIIFGTYIECIYIALYLSGDYIENSGLIQKIAEQKYAFINLMKSCELRKNDLNVADVLKYLVEIQDVYSNVKMIEGPKREMIRTADGKIRFKGGPKLQIEKKEYYKLKETFTRIRTEIITNK